MSTNSGTKEPFVIDLFYGDFHGAWLNERQDTDRGFKPKIRKMATGVFSSLIPALAEESYFDFEITSENIHTIDNYNGPDFKLLVPTEDVPGLNYEETIFAEMSESIESKAEERKRKIKKLKKEKKKLKKENKKLSQEEEEKKKHESSSSNSSTNKIPCRSCSNSYSKRKWQTNNWRCPNCNQKHPRGRR